jgi:hypothetical protein
LTESHRRTTFVVSKHEEEDEDLMPLPDRKLDHSG